MLPVVCGEFVQMVYDRCMAQNDHQHVPLAEGAGGIVGRSELAIEVRDATVVDRLHKIAAHDWEHSHPLDLSDAGLLADLDRVEGAAELLAIENKRTDADD